MWSVERVVAVGLHHHGSRAIGERDAFVHDQIVANDPRCKYCTTHNTGDPVTKETFFPWNRGFPKRNRSNHREEQQQLGARKRGKRSSDRKNRGVLPAGITNKPQAKDRGNEGKEKRCSF